MHEQRANGQVPGVPLRAHAIRHPTTTSQPAVLPAPHSARAPQRDTSQYVRTMTSQPPLWQAESEEDAIDSPGRRPSSAVRYTDTRGRAVVQQGSRRYVLGTGTPPSHRKRSWLLPVGVGMLVMLVLMVGGSWLVSAIEAWQESATYGFPRVFQTDENVGHEQGKSHFLFENLNGHIFFEEIPEGDDFKHAVLYTVTVLYGPDAAQVPVTATFADVNHDGKLDILIHLGEQTIVYLNTGTGFKPAQ